jgi:nanoRNase/pAp phosphatase (c-di-AMP/oligoRNAs hydrolase)
VELQSSRTQELLGILGRYAGQRLFVAVLGSPDPDGLASAWALRMLARHSGVTMDILTFEVVSRPDNMVFAQLLGIPFRQVVGRLPRLGFQACAVVDRQNARLPVPQPKRLPLLVHIDHHAPVPTGAVFSQQDPTAGSTCTLMAFHVAELFRLAPPDPNEACRLATALMYGIRTDTMDFVTARAADLQAAALLAPYASAEMTRTIVQTPLGKTFLETLSVALRTVQSRNGLTVAYAGKVGRRARDTIGETADFLARAEGTNTIIVYGLVNGRFNGSLRAQDPTLDPYAFLDGALSGRLGFPVDCGGRKFSGGFSVALTDVAGGNEEAACLQITDALMSAWSARKTPRRASPRRPRKA